MSHTVPGWISFKIEEKYYTLRFSDRGWLAADLAQYLDEVVEASDPVMAVLRLLGYTMSISSEPTPRSAEHWVEIDIKERKLETNSGMVSKAVDGVPPDEGEPFSPIALRRLHQVLDRYDFSVTIFR